MIKIAEIIEVPPTCTWCEFFRYKRDAEELYRCKAICMQTNDIYEMWEECPYIEKKYLIREDPKEEGDD